MSNFDRKLNLNLDIIVEDVKLKERILTFLRPKDFEKELERNCIYLQQKLQAEKRLNDNLDPFFVRVSLKYEEIDDPDLLYLITKETKHFKFLVEEISLCFINSYFRDKNSVVKVRQEQIHSTIRFYDLPLIPEFTFRLGVVHINCSLTTFCCIVSSRTPAQDYIRQSVWKCSNCFGSSCIIRKSGDKETCKRCFGDCSEIVSQRKTSSFCSVRVFDVDSFKGLKAIKPSVTSTIELKLFDDLCQDLRLGHEYIVTGIFEPFKRFYHVWSIFLASET